MAAGAVAGQALELLNKYLVLPARAWEAVESHKISNHEEARKLLVGVLTPTVKDMLDHAFERLIHAVYRIDIPEKELMAILEQSPPAEVATRLTEAIVDRQLEKISLREKYRGFAD